MSRSTRKPAPRGSAVAVFARPLVFVPIALLLLALGGWIWQQQREAAAAAAARDELLQLVLSATTRAEPDPDELSRLAADLAALPDHESAPDLLAAAARIELARRRPERAQALFGVLAANPAATPVEQALGAEILIRLHATDVGNAAAATGTLRQAAELAERAYAASRDPNDLLRAWQAATRLQDTPAVERHTAELEAAAPQSPAAALARLAAGFDVKQTPLADVDALRVEFAVPPPELDAMRVLLVLQGGDVRAAAAAAEALLLRAPGVVAVRWAAATVFHVCMLGYPKDSGERLQWLRRRDPQLDWLLQRAPADDKRRPQWDALRGQR